MASRASRIVETSNRAGSRKQLSPSRRPTIQQRLATDPGDGTLRSGVVASRASPLIPASLRHEMIRDLAYFRAEARGFAPGRDVEDWLVAEQEIDELIVRRFAR